ncbi:MAG: polyketide synthase, partial [Cytophagales bacterium]|nr:polyketide synthase [Cytophagales bacterium]
MENQRHQENKDIAIIGIHGRFPGADNIREYWENLCSGRVCTKEIPRSRWDLSSYSSEVLNEWSEMGKWGGFLNGVDKFDPLLFGISPKEAKEMDPQERLMLESVWTSLEDAGYGNHRSNKKHQIGLFVGIGTMADDYTLCSHEYGYLKNKYCGAGSLGFSIANRTSFALNLSGPSMSIDTACSSSHVAVHQACQSMLSGNCDMAIVGGVNLILHPFKYIHQFQEGLLSPLPERSLFAPETEGYIPGEGVGSLVLKPLAKAEMDEDHIYGVVKGIATNHSGSSMFYMLPNATAQARSLTQALGVSGIEPSTLSYIEMASYGSERVDTTEFKAFVKAFKDRTRTKQFCALGSVKPNIGHLEAASGISQIIKVLQQFRFKKLTPTKFSNQVVSGLNIENSPFYFQKEFEDWKPLKIKEHGITKTTPRRAGISAFGAGGTNVHLILEEY